MIRMVADMKLVLNELSDAAAGPDLPAQAKGFGPFEQQGDKLRVLVSAQQGWRAGCGVVTQSGDPVECRPLQPLADRALGNPQGLRDLLLGPTVLMQVPGPEAATFRPTSRRVTIGCAHEARVQHIPAHDY